MAYGLELWDKIKNRGRGESEDLDHQRALW